MPSQKFSNLRVIPLSIWGLGLATFFMNASSVIVFGLGAVYMKTVIGAPIGLIGFVEGFVEGLAFLMKLFSGVFSDYIRRRKSLMVFGFSFCTTSRLLLIFSTSFWGIFISRILSRIGNGLQATPRDALVGDLAPPHTKGASYGLRQALATAGSFVGGIIGLVAMILTGENFQLVFWITVLLALIGIGFLVFMVHEPETTVSYDASQKRHPIHWKDITRLGKPYWLLMGVVGVFMISRVSEAMLILHAHGNFGLSDAYTPLVLMLYNGANAVASYPVGRLSDRVSRLSILGGGIFALIVADLILAFAPNLLTMLLGVVIWGVQIGVTQSMCMALVADKVPADLRGTGFGFFYLISAISLFIASGAGGILIHTYGETVMFLASGAVGVVSLVLLGGLSKRIV